MSRNFIIFLALFLLGMGLGIYAWSQPYQAYDKNPHTLVQGNITYVGYANEPSHDLWIDEEALAGMGLASGFGFMTLLESVAMGLPKDKDGNLHD